MINSIGGRKAAICIVTLAVCVGIVLVKGDVPDGLQTMLQFIVGTYIAGNVGADLVAAKRAGDEAKAAPTTTALEAVTEVIASDNSDALARIEEGQKQLGAGIKVCQDGLSYIVSQIGRSTNKG